ATKPLGGFAEQLTRSAADFLVWLNDSADAAFFGKLWPIPAVIACDDVDVFQSRTGVEEDYRITLLEKARGAQFLVGGKRGRAFWCCKHTFVSRPFPESRHRFVVGDRNTRAFALSRDIEHDEIAESFGYSQSGGKRFSVLPHLARRCAFLKRLDDRRASSGLHGNHAWTLRADPAQLFHFTKRFPHADHSNSAARRVDDRVRQRPAHLLGHFVTHRLFALCAKRLFQGGH